MSTRKSGKPFEEQIYALFEADISNGRFFARKEHCRIYSQKGYYSRDRRKNIVFDVSIEIRIPGQEAYSVLVLIECKNYSHPVPVDDVEEFYAKLQQVAGANVKGIVASTHSFQDGAFRFCESKGIGLFRYYDKSTYKWELTRSPSSAVSAQYAQNDWASAYTGLTVESHLPKYFDCYGYSNRRFTNSSRLFFDYLISEGTDDAAKNLIAKVRSPSEEVRRIVPFLEESTIETIASEVLDAICYRGGPVPLTDVCKWQEQDKGLRVVLNAPQSAETAQLGVLGRISFDPAEIVVFSAPDSRLERHSFTLAHELGHWFLNHREYMAGEYCEARDFDFDEPLDMGIKDIIRMEWQANRFASALLLPKAPFLADFNSVAERLELQDRGFGILFLDNQHCNIATYHRVTNVLKRKYHVSRSVVKIRLKTLGVLNESRW